MSRPYTEDQLKAAQAAIDAGGNRREIAEGLGHSPGSLAVTLCLYRQGKWNAGAVRLRREKVEADLERLIAERGIVRLKELARATGSTVPTVASRLLTMGLDLANRRELAGTRRAA